MFGCVIGNACADLMVYTGLFADKALKDTLDKLLLSGYFDKAHDHQNGLCEEGEEQLPAPESSEAEEPHTEPGNLTAVRL